MGGTISPKLNGGSSKEVSIVIAYKCLILVIAINDEWRQLVDAVGLIHELNGIVEDGIQVVVHNHGTLWLVTVNELEEWIRSSI